MPTDVVAILEEIKRSGTDVRELLDASRKLELRNCWLEDPRLHQAFARRLIDEGSLYAALDLIDDGLRCHPRDLLLKFLKGLAHNRALHTGPARETVEELQLEVDQNLRIEAEVFALRGSQLKEEYRQETDAARKQQLALQAAEQYLRAGRLHETSYVAINAATASRLAGKDRMSRSLAKQALRLVRRELDEPGSESGAHYHYATIGEAFVLLGDTRRARKAYRKAVKRTGNRLGDLASMRRNLDLLRDVLPDVQPILKLFDRGTVVVCSGHILDRPDRVKPPRFPDNPQFIDRVKERIHGRLDRLKAAVGYCSAASGADLLFAEAILEREAELHVVLPFNAQEFFTTSIDFGFDARRAWKERAERVFNQASEIHYATQDLSLGHEMLYQFCNDVLQGLSIEHARRLSIPAVGLFVIDEQAEANAGPPKPGGTRDSRDRWQLLGHECSLVRLDKLRARFAFESSPVRESPQRFVRTRNDIERRPQVMLFADVKGCSQIQDEHSPAFFVQFLGVVSQVIQELERKPLVSNTWGDGLFLVFDRVIDGAAFALTLIERVRQQARDFDSHSPEIGFEGVRVGMHAGPVYWRDDPVRTGKNVFGRHVNLAARIEPVAPVNSVYVTEQFAALLALERDHPFVCNYVSRIDLPKSSGSLPLYQLRKRH